MGISVHRGIPVTRCADADADADADAAAGGSCGGAAAFRLGDDDLVRVDTKVLYSEVRNLQCWKVPRLSYWLAESGCSRAQASPTTTNTTTTIRPDTSHCYHLLVVMCVPSTSSHIDNAALGAVICTCRWCQPSSKDPGSLATTYPKHYLPPRWSTNLPSLDRTCHATPFVGRVAVDQCRRIRTIGSGRVRAKDC
jgi:hypothetical protein